MYWLRVSVCVCLLYEILDRMNRVGLSEILLEKSVREIRFN